MGYPSFQYIKEAEKNYKDYLSEHLPLQYCVPKLAPNPFLTKYEPDNGISPDLDPVLASYFQSLTGIMCWMIELGCHCTQHYHVEVTWMLLLNHGFHWFAPQFMSLYGSNISRH